MLLSPHENQVILIEVLQSNKFCDLGCLKSNVILILYSKVSKMLLKRSLLELNSKNCLMYGFLSILPYRGYLSII